jgi:uncharacterized protein (DUF1800 family)
MSFSPDIAAIRFGCGLSPRIAPPASVEDMLGALAGPDRAAVAFPLPDFDSFRPDLIRFAALTKARRKARGSSGYEAADKAYKRFRQSAGQARLKGISGQMMRCANTGDGLRERLMMFWADHFTAQGKSGLLKVAAAPYWESAIRPNLTGTFADLLIAAVTHPLMLHYLDQVTSAGPGSKAAARQKRLSGLNENLAREVLELHTLGVDGPYTQEDVRQLAELFTGLSASLKDGFIFRKSFAEPGSETVLGRTYDAGDGLQPVLDALRDLAEHPATADHIARKLAVHFVSDQPDPALVAHIAGRYRDSGGGLMAVYRALLEHPAAWRPELENVKPPFDFIASAFRALDVPPARLKAARPRDLQRGIVLPLRMMGQDWEYPAGPDGWPEEDSRWITPQGLAARMGWAIAAPPQLLDQLPDPEGFALTGLGSFADGRVRFAARSAETRAEAVGLVLSSPAFQRR